VLGVDFCVGRGARSGPEQREWDHGDAIRTAVRLGAGVRDDETDAGVADLFPEPQQVFDVAVVDGAGELTSMARTPWSPSTMKSTSWRPPSVRRWYTCASQFWAKVLTDSAADDSKMPPRNPPPRGTIVSSESPRNSWVALRRTNRADNAGSAR